MTRDRPWRRSFWRRTTTTCAASWCGRWNGRPSVVSFAEGASAFEEIKQATFDLLLTDIVMPEMDGIELARRAAELDPSLKIMFITGFAAVALHPDSRAPKEAKVLSKPFHLRDLVAEVDRMMAA